MANLEDDRGRSAPEPVSLRLAIPWWGSLPLSWLRTERWLTAAIAVGLVALWEWLASMGLVSTLFFPAPSTIGAALLRLATTGELWIHLSATFSRLLQGLLLGGVPALILGLWMGWSRSLRVVVDPFIAATHPIPKIAILPLIMVIFGIGESSKVIAIAISTFFPMLINTMAGVREISPIHFEVAVNYGASRLKTFTRVVAPGSLPMVLAGARLALNTALMVTISVEIVTAHIGLGSLVWFAWQTLRVEELYASLLVMAVVGITFNLVLHQLTARLVPWQVEREV